MDIGQPHPQRILCEIFPPVRTGFVDMINNCFDTGVSPPSQRHGLITLACKDADSAQLLTNWRPISLLQIIRYLQRFYPLSRTASTKIKCAIPGRSTQDDLNVFRDVVDFANDHDVEAGIVSYNHAKAFDRVSHEQAYLFNVLRAFGFTENFVGYVALLYRDISSSFIVNGFISYAFSSGVTQPSGALRHFLKSGPPLILFRLGY